MADLIQKTPQLRSVSDFMKANEAKLARMIPQHIDGKRLITAALSVVMGDQRLARCDASSLLNSLLQAVACGVEINTPLQHAYLVAYGQSCQLQIGYRGLIHLARQSGEVTAIYAHPVCEPDVFKLTLGSEPSLVHEPAIGSDRGDPTGYYAVIQYLNGTKDFEYMTTAEVQSIRKRSKAGSNGPWVTDFDEMARKTVIRRLLKRAPLTTAAARATQIDNLRAMGERVDFGKIVPEASDIEVPADDIPDGPSPMAPPADDDVPADAGRVRGGAE